MASQEQQQACMERKKSHGRNSSPPSHHHHNPFTLLSFFKIMMGNFSEALFFPPIVAKKLSALLNRNVDIEDSNGNRWGVKVSLVDNRMAFEQGWRDFVLDHSLKGGEFVVFNHVDSLLFSAKIYALTGCERLEFIEKSIAGKSKGKRKNKVSADDLSLKKCQSVGKLDKDVVDSNEGSIKKNQTKKSASGDTSDSSRMVTRSAMAGVKRKGEDVNALRTSHFHCKSSKRPQIEILEPVVVLDEMVDKTCQISPAGPVNMDVDVMTMTDGDNSNNVDDSSSEGMSRDFVMEEQMPDVELTQVPVKVASRDSIFMKGNITVSCNAVGTDKLVTNEQSLHGSLSETIVDPVIRNNVLTRDNPQGVVAVPSVNLIASEDKGNLCGAIEADTLLINEELSPHYRRSPVKCQPLLTSEFDGHGSQNENIIVDPLISDGMLKGKNPQENGAVSSVRSIPTETIGSTYDVQQTTDEGECTGCGSRNETEANCKIAADPLVSDKVITGDLPQGRSTAEGIKIKPEDVETDSSESFDDDDVMEGNFNALDGAVYKLLGTLQGICYIVKEDFTYYFCDGIVNPIDLWDADDTGILHRTDGTFNEDKSCHISPSAPLDKVPQNEEELGLGKMPVVSLEENEKKASLSSEVTVHEDLKPECMDLLELPPSSSFIFKFCLPSNNTSLKLPNCIPYSFGKMFLLRKVLVLQDPVMRKWPVLYCESTRFIGFIGGWKDFTEANDLKEGDTCELYLTDKENHTFLVRIKKAENPPP